MVDEEVVGNGELVPRESAHNGLFKKQNGWVSSRKWQDECLRFSVEASDIKKDTYHRRYQRRPEAWIERLTSTRLKVGLDCVDVFEGRGGRFG